MTDLPENLAQLAEHAGRLRGLLDSKRFELTHNHPAHTAWTETQIAALDGRLLEIEAICAAHRARTEAPA
jgi:hypothetical protein